MCNGKEILNHFDITSIDQGLSLSKSESFIFD